MEWQVEYYKKENGTIPVLEYLLTLPPKMRAKAFSEIELLEKHGSDLREPYAKPIKGDKYKDLFELRVKFSSDISRIFTENIIECFFERNSFYIKGFCIDVKGNSI